MRLAPRAIATRLFDVAPDRDERASQLCMEALLTVVANGYAPPDDGQLRSPKLSRFAVRSLVLETNFLHGFAEPLRFGEMSTSEYGSRLAAGDDFQGADNLALARTAL